MEYAQLISIFSIFSLYTVVLEQCMYIFSENMQTCILFSDLKIKRCKKSCNRKKTKKDKITWKLHFQSFIIMVYLLNVGPRIILAYVSLSLMNIWLIAVLPEWQWQNGGESN